VKQDPSVGNTERKCAENYNNGTIKLFLNAISILVISNHDSFRVLFDKIAPCILFEK